MNSEKSIGRIDLTLFAEGSQGAADGTGSAETTGVEAGGPDLQTKGVKNPLSNVIYGKQEDAQAAGTQTQQPATQNDLNTEFDELVKGRFKEQYNQRVQDTVQRRLKSTKETVDKYNQLAPTLELLAQKYGVDASDIEKLNAAIAEDDAYYEEEALEKGLSVEQLKEIKKMERENSELRRQMEERQQQEEIDREIADWMQQAEEASKIFPNLDLGEELKNPQFISLMKDGVGLQTAYFAIHHEELVPQAMQFAQQKAEEKIRNNIIANGNRPYEGASKSQASAIVKNDVSQLTKADRQEIIRRVQRGEKIRF